MQEINFKLPLGVIVLLTGLSDAGLATASVPNFSIPGISPPGYVHFDNTASITLTRDSVANGHGYTLTSSSQTFIPSLYAPTKFDFQVSPSSPSDPVINGDFELTAHFSPTGTFTTGDVSIFGSIPSYSGPGNTGTVQTTTQKLFSATLASPFGGDVTADSTPLALGFTTLNSSFDGWASQFASPGANESVYLYSFNVPALVNLIGNPRFTSSITFQGAAFTTVPIPAATWLFGSALALAPWARQKKAKPA